MTDIVEIPETLPIAPFPALGSANYNQEAYDNGASVPPAIERARAIVAAGRTNAVAASEQALAAQESREQAVSETTAIKDAAVSETTAIKDAAVSETTAIKDAAALSAVAAADSAAAAQAVANFAGRWGEATGPLPKGVTVHHMGKFWVLLEALADVALAEPGVSSAWVKAGVGIDTIAYDSRANLRARVGVDSDMALIDGLGLFVFAAGSDEPDDDESCFATTSGRWLLQAAHWDVVDAWQAPDDAARDAWDEDEALRFAGSFASKVLTGSATCAITTVGGQSSVSFAGTVAGAAVGDRVIATPPAQLGSTAIDTAFASYHAWVSGANTVTVMLTCPVVNGFTTNPAIRTEWPITVIKP